MSFLNEDHKRDEIFCPLTKKIFCEPVVTLTGTTYEKEAIEDWMECSSMEKSIGHSSSERMILSPNLYIKTLISNLTLKQPELLNNMYIPRSWREALASHILHGNLVEAQNLLNRQPNLIELTLDNGKRALHLAAEQSNKETLNFILSALVKNKKRLKNQKGTNIIKIKYPNLSKMLVEKIETEDEDALDILISHGADINQVDENQGETILHSAIKEGKPEKVSLILKNQAEIDSLDYNGNTPLHLAILGRKTELARILIESGASKIIKNKEGYIPLYVAILVQSREITGLFLGKETARLPWLYLAYKYGGSELLETLLKMDWQLGSEMNFQGNMPLFFFVVEELYDAVEIMMKHKIDPLQTCGLEMKSNPLNTAVKYGDLRMINILLSGTDKKRLLEMKTTPLHVAVKENNTELIKFFIEQGFYIKRKDENNKTPLSIAKEMNRDDLVDILKETAYNLSFKRIEKVEGELCEERRKNLDLMKRIEELEKQLGRSRPE